MAVTTRQASPGPVTAAGHVNAILGAAGADQLKVGPGKLARVVISNVGTTWTIDIYDDGSTTGNKVWTWASANGTGTFDLEIPMQAGIRVVTTGTPGVGCIVWA